MNPWRPNSPLSGMPLIKDGVHSKRESSYDRTGANRDFVRVETGETATLCDIEGCGCIKHIWLTTFCQAPQFLLQAVLPMRAGSVRHCGRTPKLYTLSWLHLRIDPSTGAEHQIAACQRMPA